MIEEAKMITSVVRSVPAALDDEPITQSPEICLGTDNGIYFMNVFISKNLPHMNGISMYKEQIP
jgi:hypothetical protein